MSESSEEKEPKQKKSLGKRILKWIGIVLLVIVILLFIVVLRLGTIVKNATPVAVNQILKCDASIEDATIRPIAGVVTIENLIIKNPHTTVKGEKTNFATPFLFKLGKIHIDMDMTSVTTDTIVINDILIEGPEVTYEKVPLYDSNLQVLMDILNAKAKAEEEKAKDPAKKDESGASKKVVIKHFLLKGTKVNFKLAGVPGNVVAADIELTEKDFANGVSIPQVIATIFKALFNNVINVVNGAGSMVLDAGKSVGGAAANVGKNVGGKATEAGKAIGSAAKDAGGAVMDGIKNLNPFK